jgi:ATP-binding cassette subfamily B protein
VTPERGAVRLRTSGSRTRRRFVLRDVLDRRRPGETVAIVGATGSGKSTMIKLLGRSFDVSRGSVKVSGVDVREWDLIELRREIGIVLQDAFLFSGTLAGNITLGREEVSDETLAETVRAVNLESFVMTLPRGFEQPIRERGNNLSAGQRQLLAFARALAYDPRILVLDEATSSVDAETEQLVQDALDRLLRGRTAIVIAHRLSTIERADRILVMDGGKIAEQGSHADLLRSVRSTRIFTASPVRRRPPRASAGAAADDAPVGS